jgi:hypothetical protein
MNSDEYDILLERLAAVLIRCFFLSLLLLCCWFLFYLTGGTLGRALHSQWFGLSKHDFDLLNYFGVAFAKICAILFFLFPYISIRWVLRNRRKKL